MKTVLRFFATISAILIICTANALAFNTTVLQSGSTVTVSGVSGVLQDVTLQVLNPNTPTENIDALQITDMFYIGQTASDWKGNFSFDVDIKSGVTYPAIISNGDDYRVISLSRESVETDTLNIVFTTDRIGNIFKDYTNINYTLEIDGFGENSHKYTVTETVISEASNATVYTNSYDVEAESGGINRHKASINMSTSSQKYGTFRLEITVVDAMQRQAQLKTVFSVIHTADSVLPNRLLGTGLSFNNKDEKTEIQREISQLFYDVGYSRDRGQILWHDYEPTEGNFVMRSSWKNSINIQNEVGYKDRIWIYGYGNSKLGIPDPPITSTELEAYGKYVYNLTKELKDYTNNFEVWNETNWRAKYYPELTPQVYFNILKVSAENAKKANENVKLYISLGAMVYNTDEKYDIYSWLKQLMDMGAAEYFDALSFHVYTGKRMPEYDVSKTEVVKKLRKILTDYGYSNIPIVLTETGYSSDDVDYNEWEQAMYSLRDFAMLYDAGLEAIHFYNAIEKQDGNAEQDNFGHINTWTPDYVYNASGVAYSAKPVFAAFANFNTLLSNAELIEKKENKFGNYDYQFKAVDGTRVHMIWNSIDINSTYTLNTDSKMVIIYDIFGNSVDMKSTDGNYTINTSGAPCYVVIPENPLYIARDSQGNHIDRINADTVYIDTDNAIISQTGATKVIAAKYNNGMLVGCEVLDVSQGGENGVLVNTANSDKLSVFTFKDFNTMMPLEDKFELFRQEERE